jgi:S1-C subfamily serine protease
MSTLSDFSNGLADVVARSAASTVRIEARRRLPATGFAWESGIIVTAHHVVERDENIKIGLPNGETAEATLVGRDPSTDVAVLKLKTTNSGLNTFERASFESMRVGNLVLALGRPGKDVLSTLGIVSAIGQDGSSRAGHLDYFIQTDVEMFPGFSGGPLVDANGTLVGMNTSAMRDTSLTIPVPTLARVVDTLVKHGKVKQGYLGVGAQPVRLPTALKESLGQETALLIASVESDSPADKGGLLLGDTLVSFGGRQVRSMDDLAASLASNGVGATVPAKIVRGGQTHEVSITIGERP